ncbi:hypothetical protein Ancab_001497 [Ancistrocladus abbreviatus]
MVYGRPMQIRCAVPRKGAEMHSEFSPPSVDAGNSGSGSFYPSVLGNDTTVAVGDAFRKSFLMSNASEDPSKKLDHSVAANSAQVTSFSANQAAAILAVLACSSNRNSSAVFRAQLNKLS